MTNKPKNITRSDLTEFDGRVGQAYSSHIRLQYDEAIAQYRTLLDEWPDHIDANYGLSLALKASGRADAALEGFGKTRNIVQNEMAKNAGGDTARFQMLLRMIDQQVGQIRGS